MPDTHIDQDKKEFEQFNKIECEKNAKPAARSSLVVRTTDAQCQELLSAANFVGEIKEREISADKTEEALFATEGYTKSHYRQFKMMFWPAHVDMSTD